MTTPLQQAFDLQGRACASLGSAFMGRLMPLIGSRMTGDTAIGARCLAWTGDIGPAGQSVPLRLAGALHGLVLGDLAPDLAAAYPPNDVPDDTLWNAVAAAFLAHEARLMDWLDRPPQTNEVRRAAAIIAGIWWALDRVGDMPVALSELGASGGLNLSLDRFALSMGRGVFGPANSPVRLSPDWRGPFPSPHQIRVADRRGVDLTPLDPTDPDDALRLLAYLWPDQPERITRTRAVISLSGASVDAGDAAPWLADRLANPVPGLHVVYSTIAAQYFPDGTRKAIATRLRDAGARATPVAPLLHLAMEADDAEPGAGLTATLWSGGAPVQRHLARVDFHLAWINWMDDPAPDPVYPLQTR